MTAKQLRLTKGYVATVDADDFESVSRTKWCALVIYRKDGSVWNVYGQRRIRRADGKAGIQLLHRFIMEVDDPNIRIDHVNHDGLNCQRHNLRVCTQSQNLANSLKRRDNTSGIKGVYWNKQRSKWVAQIGINGVKKGLGYFPTKEAAGQAYAQAAQSAFGSFSLVGEAA